MKSVSKFCLSEIGSKQEKNGQIQNYSEFRRNVLTSCSTSGCSGFDGVLRLGVKLLLSNLLAFEVKSLDNLLVLLSLFLKRYFGGHLFGAVV